MSLAQTEFLIESSITAEPGRLSVIGRCCDEPVPVGTRFRFLYRYRLRPFPHGLNDPAVVEQVFPADLTVEAIRACGRDFAELPPGWAGELVLVADRPNDLLPGGWALGSHDPRTLERRAVPAESKVGS